MAKVKGALGPVRHPEASSSSLGSLYMPMVEGTRESVPGPFGSWSYRVRLVRGTGEDGDTAM